MGLPDANLLPAPLWLLNILHLLTLSLHFIAMNFVLGGTLIVLFGRFGDNRWDNPTLQRMVKLLPNGMAATITLGVAPLLFLQLIYPKQVYSAAIVSGWFWLMIVVATGVAYYALYATSFGNRGSGSKTLYLSIAAVCLLYVSLVYTSVLSMAEMPALTRRLYAESQSGLVFNPALGTWIWRWLHMVLAAITVGGFFVGVVARDDSRGYQVGKGFFLGGVIATSLTGLMHLVSLGELVGPLMRSTGIYWLSAGIVLAFAALHFYTERRFLAAGMMLFASVIGMVVTRHTLRLIRLGGELVIPPLRSQWLVFGLFLACFVGALALIAWMLKLFFQENRDAPS